MAADSKVVCNCADCGPFADGLEQLRCCIYAGAQACRPENRKPRVDTGEPSGGVRWMRRIPSHPVRPSASGGRACCLNSFCQKCGRFWAWRKSANCKCGGTLVRAVPSDDIARTLRSAASVLPLAEDALPWSITPLAAVAVAQRVRHARDDLTSALSRLARHEGTRMRPSLPWLCSTRWGSNVTTHRLFT